MLQLEQNVVSPLIFVPPVLSALLGAVAIRCVEILSARRSGYSAIHHELAENYWRLEGEAQTIENGNWIGEFRGDVRLDLIEAVKARTPEVYMNLVSDVEKFPVVLANLENAQINHRISKEAGTRITSSEDEILQEIRKTQNLIVTVEDELRKYTSKAVLRRVILYKCLSEVELERVDSELENLIPEM